MKTSWFVSLLVVIVIVATLYRLPKLAERPMHGDEANQAHKTGVLIDTGVYRYDPREHHGPVLYYATLPIAWLTSAKSFQNTTETAFRLVPVIFGIALVLIHFGIAGGIGRSESLIAALLTAVSTGMVYYSRYYIQETLLVFFTFAALISAWEYTRTRRAFWVIIFGVCLGLTHATKETCVFTFAAFALAWLGARAWTFGPRLSAMMPREGVNRRHVLLCACCTAIISVTLFSSFFSNWSGPIDSIRTYFGYAGKAGEGLGHSKPWFYYVQMLLYFKNGPGPWWSEGFIIGLAVVGVIAVIEKKGSSAQIQFGRFLVLYAALQLAIYSAIPYKTPWCVLSALHGLILLAGIGSAALIRWFRNLPARMVVAAFLALGTAQLGVQAYRASFEYAADRNNPYVYAHTATPFLRLVKRVEDLSKISPEGKHMLIGVVVSNGDYWPLPFYLRQYDQVGYWTSAEAVPQQLRSAPVFIASPDQVEKLLPALGAEYLTEFHGLRPQVLLTVCIRKDLWESFMQTRQ